jgi:hypothetical protein
LTAAAETKGLRKFLQISRVWVCPLGRCDMNASMKPSKYREALNAYSMLMEEAKQRLLAMDTALRGQTGLPRGAIREFCFMQLRMLCELIALGCLTAHGDVETGKLKEAYEADRIIRRLMRLHSEFYPIGATWGKAGPVLRKDGFLTKEELSKLYWKCGDVLHRGSFKALSIRRYSDTDIEEIRTWKQKIESLLACHAIFMLTSEQWFCSR